MTPEVRVVRGDPDELELAALVAGLVAGAGRTDRSGGAGHDGPDGPAQRAARARRRWCDAQSPLASATRPSPDAWRWSARG